MPKFRVTDKVQAEPFHDATGIVTDIYEGIDPTLRQYWVVFPFPIGVQLMPESLLKSSPN